MNQSLPPILGDFSAPQSVAVDHIFQPKSLVLRITYKCNIGCRFCYNASVLGSDVKLDEERMLSVLTEGRAAGFVRLGISGGEAFLFTNQVINLIKKAKEIGYETVSVVTNGFWGKSEKSTDNLMRLLLDAGFAPPNDFLSMSAGEYHQEFIPPSYARNIIKAYYKAYETPFTIDFEIADGQDYLVDEFNAYMDKEGVSKDWYKMRMRTYIAPIGRGKDLEEGSFVKKPANVYAKCNTINRFAVQPDGFVVPCCGFNRTNKGINLGNVYDSSIAEIIEDSNKNIVNQYLTHMELRQIHTELSKHFDIPAEYAANCELCETLFGKEEHIEHLKKMASEFLPSDPTVMQT